MSEERTKDLPMRLRRSRGLALSSSWLEKLSQASDLQIKEDDLLSLEETERLRNMFLERLRATPEQQWFWSGEERSHVIAALRSIPVQSHTKVILFSDVDI